MKSQILKNLKSVCNETILSMYEVKVVASKSHTKYDTLADQDITNTIESGEIIALVDCGMMGQWYTHYSIDENGIGKVLNRYDFAKQIVSLNHAPKWPVTAIYEEYTRRVNKAYSLIRKYHGHVNLDGTFETDKEQNANDRKQEAAFDKFTEVFGELPKREQANLDKQHKALHGYSV